MNCKMYVYIFFFSYGQCLYIIAYRPTLKRASQEAFKTRRSPPVDSLLANHLRRRPNINPTSGDRLVFVGKWTEQTGSLPMLLTSFSQEISYSPLLGKRETKTLLNNYSLSPAEKAPRKGRMERFQNQNAG